MMLIDPLAGLHDFANACHSARIASRLVSMKSASRIGFPAAVAAGRGGSCRLVLVNELVAIESPWIDGDAVMRQAQRSVRSDNPYRRRPPDERCGRGVRTSPGTSSRGI